MITLSVIILSDFHCTIGLMKQDLKSFFAVVVLLLLLFLLYVICYCIAFNVTYLHAVTPRLSVWRGTVDDVGVTIVELSVAFSWYRNDLKFLQQ
jgi:hypothetical protein